MRLFIILFLVLAPLSAAWPEPLNTGSTAPDWSLQTKDGETLNYYEDSDN
jgi:hypothetical protein